MTPGDLLHVHAQLLKHALLKSTARISTCAKAEWWPAGAQQWGTSRAANIPTNSVSCGCGSIVGLYKSLSVLKRGTGRKQLQHLLTGTSHTPPPPLCPHFLCNLSSPAACSPCV